MKAGARVRKVVLPAIFGALALIFLFIAAVSPTGSWGIAAVAGLMPVAVVLAVGISAGFLCWAGVTILAFLLLPASFGFALPLAAFITCYFRLRRTTFDFTRGIDRSPQATSRRLMRFTSPLVSTIVGRRRSRFFLPDILVKSAVSIPSSGIPAVSFVTDTAIAFLSAPVCSFVSS